jgi:phage gp36-like protein
MKYKKRTTEGKGNNGTCFVLFGEEEIQLIIVMDNPQGQQTEVWQSMLAAIARQIDSYLVTDMHVRTTKGNECA